MTADSTPLLFRALRDVSTPALAVDESALGRNVTAMAEFARRARRSLRPHAKTHKSAEIARKQLDAGAIGICCATVREMEALAAARIGGLLLTAPAQDPSQIGRIVDVAKKASITLAADHTSQIEMLRAKLSGDTPPINIIVDVDVGQWRTGVCEVRDTIALAELVSGDKRLKFLGLQGYAGHVQHIPEFANRTQEASRAGALLGEHIAALREAGFGADIVSGSGTGTFDCDLAHEPFTEVQAGSYVFMDADYARVLDRSGNKPPFECSLFMLTTVVSANRPGQVTVDAGTKSLAVNGPSPHIIVGAPEGTTFRFGGDEHGILSIPEGSAAPKLGDRILMSVTHCDPTVNLFSVIHAVSKSGDVKQWQVLGRN